MADLVRNCNSEHGIDQALVALKKGTQLVKYGRKGKPKSCPFRLSNDESSLIWISSSGEKQLKLASVSKITPGQRTSVFQRYLCPEKDNQSFSLIFDDGKRSLDLICKDRVEAELWVAGLKTLLFRGRIGRSKIDGMKQGLSVGVCRDLTSNSLGSFSTSDTQALSSPTGLRNARSEIPTVSERSHVAPISTNMQLKISGSDMYRISISSTYSASSLGSSPEESDALGDVYMWGEVMCDSVVDFAVEKNPNLVTTRTDVLVPRLLESNVVLDVNHIACGVRHVALLTREGEVFSWGEESGGQLGHGVGTDVLQPRLVESLTATAGVEFVACGEFHTCAVTVTGELFTWGDGTHRAGLLGHGNEISHWMPKKVLGPLEGIRIASVSCGPWHTALITSNGQLFTFGDGTFGVLGHGDRKTVLRPREVESLSGLRTIAVGCGVWHTAALVEIIVTQTSANSALSGKLFTWGDGDKNRLGHGDKEPRLNPTCVPALIDQSFRKLACGHSLTVGVTTSGKVFTMGSTVYGQLGNPRADGKAPCLVEDKLGIECVEEIACGAYHVAVLTSRNEVYTWGKGANGRLGHGDLEDRKVPTLVEALKDRHVKYIACGSNYAAALCLHKWVSGADQSQCSACRQAFGFARKRYNCYNCGLVHCNSCTSRKAMRASLAPDPCKPSRVCDSCYAKLSRVSEASDGNRKNATPRVSGENLDRQDKESTWLAKFGTMSNLDLMKQLDFTASRQGKRTEASDVVPSSQAPVLFQMKDVLSGANDARKIAPGRIPAASGVASRSVSPLSRRSSQPRASTPVLTPSDSFGSRSFIEDLKKTNELLSQEVLQLRAEVRSLSQRCELQEQELQKPLKNVQEAMALAAEESLKYRAAKKTIKSLISQIINMSEKLPPGVFDPESIKLAFIQNGVGRNSGHVPETTERRSSKSDSITSSLASPVSWATTQETDDFQDATALQTSVSASTDGTDYVPLQDVYTISKSGSNAQNVNSNQAEDEWIEQYEPGVYITLVTLQDGTRELKRVRFSRRKFGEHQAESWWSEKRDKVYERYNIRVSDKSSAAEPAGRPSDPSDNAFHLHDHTV